MEACDDDNFEDLGEVKSEERLATNRLDGQRKDVSNFGNEKNRKQKIWTELKSGLYGWKTVTGDWRLQTNIIQ